MTCETLERLQPRQLRPVRDRFDAVDDGFDFRPSEFPGITEPTASIAWRLHALDEDPGDRTLNRLAAPVHDALTAALRPAARC